VPLEFPFRRIKKTLEDDADPNSIPPANVFRLPTRRRDLGREPVRGWIYYLLFRRSDGTEVQDGTARVTPYLQDASDLSWIAAAPDTEVGHRQAFTNGTLVNDATLFFRVTGVAGAGLAMVELRMEPI
jgi:hypothetical protein